MKSQEDKGERSHRKMEQDTQERREEPASPTLTYGYIVRDLREEQRGRGRKTDEREREEREREKKGRRGSESAGD